MRRTRGMRAEGSVLQRDADLPHIVLTAAHSTTLPGTNLVAGPAI